MLGVYFPWGVFLFALAAGGTGCLQEPATAAGIPQPSEAPVGATGPVARLIFQLPTTNSALLATGGEPGFYARTGPEKHWSSGAFGCVRNSGGRMHEGIDIRCVSRDSSGEPQDVVRVAAAGKVAFANRKGGASSYGKYLVLLHEAEGLEVYTLYAHLQRIEERVKPGLEMAAGEALGVMGRTATHDIPKERAHLHFEIGVLGSRDFESWMKKHYRDPDFNKFGIWHGYNLLGYDPSAILKGQQEKGDAFRLARHIANRPELMRIRVRGAKLPLAERLPGLVELTNNSETPKVAGHEVSVNINGTPIRIQPLTEWPGSAKARYELVSVNGAVALKSRCRRLVFKTGARWLLTQNGHKLADLLAMGAAD